MNDYEELNFISDDKYTWFYTMSKNDKIGVSPDGKNIMRDGILYPIKKFKKVEKNGINNTKKIVLIYTFDNQFNFVMHESNNLFAFHYYGKNNKITFSHITYGGKEYLNL